MASLSKCGIVAVSLGVLVCAASAGIIAGDPNGMSDWQGTVRFETTNKWLCADVDYSVYAPGDFSLSFPTWTDPTGGLEYVYAYQIFNDITRTTSVKAAVVRLSVGLSGSGAYEEQGDNIGYFADDPNHKPPTSVDLSLDTAGWNYAGTSGELKYGYISDILVYTSPFSPELDSASMSGSYSLTSQRTLPSPTPEPATMGLLGMGLCALVARRARWAKQ